MTDMDKMMIEKVAKAIVMAEYSNDTKIVWPIDFSPAEQLMAQRQAIAALTAYNPDDRLREALAELTVLRSAMTQSVWHDIPGGRAKRILVAETAIERIDAALSPLPQGLK